MNLKNAAEEIHLFARGYPPVVNLSVNTLCNQRCLFCRYWQESGKGEKDKLSLNEIKILVTQLVRDFKVRRFRIVSIEPLLRGDLPDIIRHITRYTACTLLTNGMSLSPDLAGELISAGVTKIRFSIDAPNEVNDRLRGVKRSFERAQSGLRTMLDARRKSGRPTPRIEIFSVLTRLNIDYIPAMYRIAQELGVDRLTFGIVYETSRQAVDGTVYNGRIVARDHMVPQGESIKPSRRQLDQLRRKLVRLGYYSQGAYHFRKLLDWVFNSLEHSYRVYRCPYHYFINIDAFGNVYPCSVLSSYSVGNIREKKIRDIWFSRRHHEFLRRVGSTPFPVCHELCDDKGDLYMPTLKSEIRGLVLSLLYPLNLRVLRREAVKGAVRNFKESSLRR